MHRSVRDGKTKQNKKKQQINTLKTISSVGYQ